MSSKGLVHITNVIPLNSSDDAVMKELYEVLKKHNALDKIGITLLHEHFEMSDTEILIEKDIAENITEFETVDINSINKSDYKETSWRLDK